MFNNKRRLAQILSILKKHHIAKGIDPQKLRLILEDLGPTFVKIGQIMSSRQDMFSKRYCNELVRLRDDVNPMSMDEVRSMIESEYHKPLEDVFMEFDSVPLGSASIAQVHKAKLMNGKEIVVKVQRPHIYSMMERDISLIRKASKILKLNEVLGSVVDINVVLDEFWHTAQEEMDFLNEAQFAKRFASLSEDLAYIDVPHIEDDYSTSKVLVMEYIEGFKLEQRDQLIEHGYDLKEIAQKLSDHYIKQIVDDGFFHADPHPGNIRIRDGKIIWIDFGMMGILKTEDRLLMKNAVMAIAKQNTQELVDVILTLGIHNGRIDYTCFYNDIETFMIHYTNTDLKDINLGDAIQEVFTIAHRYRISMPKGVSMLARGLVTIESTVMMVDQNMNIVEIAARHVSQHQLKNRDIKKDLLTQVSKVYDASQSCLHIPVQISEILKMISKGHIKVNLDIMDSSVPMNSINHMVNKLTVGIVSTGLLTASSLICTTQMKPKIFGIPAIGVIGYLTAVGLGIWLLYTVLKERRMRK